MFLVRLLSVLTDSIRVVSLRSPFFLMFIQEISCFLILPRRLSFLAPLANLMSYSDLALPPPMIRL